MKAGYNENLDTPAHIVIRDLEIMALEDEVFNQEPENSIDPSSIPKPNVIQKRK